MSENKFENQVQHLMDELKFTPSEEVWPAIKNRIRQKRRRRFFFFLVPLMAGLLFTGYYFLTKTNTLPVTQNSKDAPAQKFENTTPGEDNNPANTPQTQNSNAIQLQESDKLTIHNDIEQSKIKANDKLPENAYLATQVPISIQKHAEEVKTPAGTLDLIIENKQDENAEEKKLTTSVIDYKKEESNVIQNQLAGILQDSIRHNLNNELKEKVFDPLTVTNDSAKVVMVEKDLDAKWSWGLYVAAGVSKSGSETFPGFAPTIEYNSSPNSGGPLLAYASKSSQSGTSIEAGFMLQRQFTPRSSISTGLQYFYASDRIIAGTRYDSTIRVQNPNSNSLSFDNTVNSYYRGNDQWYNNHYHFIELPIQYQYLLYKRSKLPIELQAGLIFSQLISTNGLVYDRALSGIYYEDKKQFNQSMLSISSGVKLHFNHKQKIKWSIGPQVRAGITSMRNAAYDQNKYLFSGGLRVNLFLD